MAESEQTTNVLTMPPALMAVTGDELGAYGQPGLLGDASGGEE